MHAYCSDSKEHLPLLGFLVTTSVATWLLMRKVATPLAAGIPTEFAGLFELPSLGAVFGLFYVAFEKALWRLHRFGIRASKIRDLQGTWVGTLDSSHNGRTVKPIVIRISQTWRHISIRAETDQSTSHSVTAAILTDDANEPGLVYQYVNTPRARRAVDSMKPHRGTASFRFTSDEDALDAEYYTNPHRDRNGCMTLTRVSRQVLSYADAISYLTAVRASTTSVAAS
jgi:hypothetical protein